MKLAPLLIVFLVVTSGFAGVAVADNSTVDDDVDTSDNATTETSDDEDEDEEIDTSQIERQVSHVQIHDIDWSDDSVEITLSGSRSDEVQVTEFNNGTFHWDSYDIGPEPTTITYTTQNQRLDEVAFSVVSAETGILLESPTASPFTFSRGAKWSDHWVSGGTAVGMVFLSVLYRYKRRQFFAKTELRSLLSGRKYRKKGDEEGWKVRILRHVYNPRSILVVFIFVLIIEILTESIGVRIASMATEAQLAVLVAAIGLPGYYYVAGRILRLIPITRQPKMLTLDNREQGEIDVVTGAKEWFDGMAVKGADRLQKKPIAGTQERAYLAHHYDAATHTAVATWHEVLDAVEVAKNYTAAFTNYHILSTEIDEAREIKSAQPALRQKYQQEAQSVAMERMDETHFGQSSTNDLMADVMDTIDHDDESNTVDTTPDVGDGDDDNSDESESEGDDDE
ncbi:hypothetical protein E2L06_04145 [Haloterrigena sp. H1]|uniref:hypothetical protein n=1 Tax=Haloterrigena sp. H1 TaxID=2552943 RepID=UPI00110D442B|nr:hypothetical protein [Haloterrigena sp. H1]TMT85825.1 hypothetical protein E2L06_04145 [Haloterrigena sp. H1]